MWQAALPSLESQFAMTKRAPAKRPPIPMIDTEADTLTDLALARKDESPAVADSLLLEIDRAKLPTADKVPGAVVTMHSRVEFGDDGNVQRSAERRVGERC